MDKNSSRINTTGETNLNKKEAIAIRYGAKSPSNPIYIGTRYFTSMDVGLGCPMPGREIGYSTFGREMEDIPYPPEMWFAGEMLNALMDWQQLLKEPEHRQYVGWSYNAPEHPDGYRIMDVKTLRFELNGKVWLWRLTGEKDQLNYREFGKWPD